MKQIYTVAEIAEILGLHYQTVLKLINTGEIPALKIHGKKLVTKEQLEAYMKGE